MTSPEAWAEDLTTILIEQLCRFRGADLDKAVLQSAKRHLLDVVGAMLAASRYPAAHILVAFANLEGGAPRASLVGHPLKTGAATASLVNGTLGYYCDIEPHHPEAVAHPMAVVVPAALAVAESVAANGASFLAASTLGVEVMCRMSLALDPRALYARGFHPTAVAGVFGAAVAAGYLLGLDDAGWRNTLGLAALQASGLLSWAADPTEHSRPFNSGIAARNGVTAATLGSMGFGGPPSPFEGKANVFHAFSGTQWTEHLTGDLRLCRAVTELATKRYACCAFLHPGLDALLAIMEEYGLEIQDIDSIEIYFPRSGAGIIDNNPLRSHCAQYILPVAARYREVAIDHILTDHRFDPEIARLSLQVRLIHDETLDAMYPHRYSTIVVVSKAGGWRREKRVDVPKGHPEDPLTEEELLNKYSSMAKRAYTELIASQIAGMVMSIERVGNVAEFGSALRGELG